MIFALHPGTIISRFDGEPHYIGVKNLVELYQLKPGEYIVWPKNERGIDRKKYVHLYPNKQGNYGRQAAELLRKNKIENEKTQPNS